jgi:hypothetical protein
MKGSGGALPACADGTVVGRANESGYQQEPDDETYVSHGRSLYHGTNQCARLPLKLALMWGSAPGGAPDTSASAALADHSNPPPTRIAAPLLGRIQIRTVPIITCGTASSVHRILKISTAWRTSWD